MHFIPFAQQTSFIRVLTGWMIERCAARSRELSDQGSDSSSRSTGLLHGQTGAGSEFGAWAAAWSAPQATLRSEFAALT